MSDANRFIEDGFRCVPSVLNPEQVVGLTQKTHALFNGPRPPSQQVLYVDGKVPEATPHLDRLLHQWLNPYRFGPVEGTTDLLDMVRPYAHALLGAPPVLFQDLLLIKEPGQSRFHWHQDFPFWPIDKPNAVVCWIPLFENRAEGAGGLQFAVGSHDLGMTPAIDLHRGTLQQPGPEPDLAAFETVLPPLSPGDAVLFSPLVFHSSDPRTLPGRRIAWSTTWLHPDCRWSHSRAPSHPLCRQIQDGARVTD